MLFQWDTFNWHQTFQHSLEPRCVLILLSLSNSKCLLFCCMCCLELHLISAIHHYLSKDVTKKLLCAFVLSRLDFCSLLLAGCPKYFLSKLPNVQSNAARLIFRTSRSAYVTPMLPSLHWLPSEQRIKYKLSLLCFNIIFHQAPICLSELLHIYTPSRQLCSSADTCVFRIPSFWTKSSGQCSFSLYCVCLYYVCVCVCMHVLDALNLENMCIKRMCKHLGPVQIRHSKYLLLLLYSGLTSSLTQFLQLTEL